MKNNANTAVLEAPTSVRRHRAKAIIVIERMNEDSGDYIEIKTDAGSAGAVLTDTASAIAFIKKSEMEGNFRVIAVKRVVTAEKVQTTTLKLT